MNTSTLLWQLLLILGAVLNVASSSSSDEYDNLANLPRKRVRRIIGGSSYEIGEWTWLAHLWGKVPSKTFWGIPMAYTHVYCGASVINKRWVLTAAHCFSEAVSPDDEDSGETTLSKKIKVPKYWHIKAGEIHSSQNVWKRFVGWLGRSLNSQSWAIWNVHADKIIIHPDFDRHDSWANDIALLKLRDDLPIDDDENIDAVPLGSDNYPPSVDQICVMKGWGCTTSGGPLAKVAQAVDLPVHDTQECADLYSVKIGNTRICAGYNLEGKGICRGDSGGPLVCKRAGTDTWYQEGIASFTSSRNSGDYPGAFTRVSVYTDWIKKTIENN